MVINNKIKARIAGFMPWIALIGAYIWDVMYHLIAGERMLDSDMSSEMILADILNKERSVTGLTNSWLYSSELRVFAMQCFYRIGLWVFPNDWHYARSLATALALLVLAVSVILVFCSIGHLRWGLWAAALTLFPGGGWYFWQTIYGGYYLTHSILTMIPLALVLILLKDITLKKRTIYTVLLIAVSLIGGMNGVKLLMMFYAPLCVTMFLLFVLSRKKHCLNAVCRRFALSSTIATLSALLGYLINSRILSQMYQFESYEDTVIECGSFFDMVRYYIWSFGFVEGKVLMSFQGIAAMCGVVIGICVLVSGARLFFRIADLPEDMAVLTGFCMISIIMTCFVMSYAANVGRIQYFQTMVPLGYFLLIMEIATEHTVYRQSRVCLALLSMILLMITSIGTVYNEDHEPYHEYRAQPGLQPIVDMLVQEGYTEGVSMFWTSNIVTELSDGKIDMWTINLDFPGQYFPWLQRRSHLENDPQDRYFYIFDFTYKDIYLDEKIEMGAQYIYDHPTSAPLKQIYADENYVIYGN